MTGELVPSVGSPDVLASGHEALRRHAWREAFELLSRADAESELGGADLEGLAEAAFFSAQGEAVTDIRERAFKARIAEGDVPRAAYIALQLARENAAAGRTSIAAAWGRRGERLLGDQPEGYAHGYLALVRSDAARAQGDLEAAIGFATVAVDIGERTRDDELRAWAMASLGTLRIASGAAPDGLALLEEASIAAVNGELPALASGVICCTMIVTCRDLTDYHRASEWIEATDRYCQRQSVSGFPGACRIHRAEIVAMGGAWERAERELERATAELAPYNATPIQADGYYALGEVRRLEGDLEGAEDALRQAHALGKSPQPALALVRLAQGKVDAASAALNAAIADEPVATPNRPRLLAALVEVALAAGDRTAARAAADDLGALVSSYPTPAREAESSLARGRVLLAEGDATGAAREFRAAIRAWRDVGSPYQVARCRMMLAGALRALGDDEDADLELRAAHDEFERLGARIDLATAEQAVRTAEERRARPRQIRRTFMFTDIVGSTTLAEALGDEAWEGLLRWHDRTLRDLFERYGGEIVNSTGDGYFVAFAAATSAVDCAAAIQREMAAHRKAIGFALDVRIGLHTATANRRGRDYSGVGVHVAARVGALAGVGEILATTDALADAPSAVVDNARDVSLRGVRGPVRVASIVWA
jgi:class 3 adenylate cyclase